MEKSPPNFWDYMSAVTKRSGRDWHGANAVLAFAGYAATPILGALALSPLLRDFLGVLITTTVSLLAIGSFVALFLVVTPYRLWRDEKVAVRASDERSAPRLQFGPAKILKDGERRHLRIPISNRGTGVLKEGLVRLITISPSPPAISTNRFPVAIPTEGQRQGGRSGRFNIDAEPKYVLVLSHHTGRADTTLAVSTEYGEIKLDGRERHRLKLAATCEEGAAVPLEFSVYVDDSNELVLEEHGQDMGNNN